MFKLDSPLITAKEAAKRLGVDRITIYRWLKSGKLKSYRLAGWSFRIKEKDLEEFIKDKKK